MVGSSGIEMRKPVTLTKRGPNGLRPGPAELVGPAGPTWQPFALVPLVRLDYLVCVQDSFVAHRGTRKSSPTLIFAPVSTMYTIEGKGASVGVRLHRALTKLPVLG